jgi:predicted nucleic-acid-binding protein
MISVDTNVLVRIFVDDDSDREQVEQARRKVRTQRAIHAGRIVLVETVWVLKSLFGFPKEQILEVLEHVLNNQAFVLDDPDAFEQALNLYRDTAVEFSDAMILIDSRRRGGPLLTFDRKLLKLEDTARLDD